MRKEDLVHKLFEKGLAGIGDRGYSVYINFENLAKTELYKVFSDDLVESFRYLQNQHGKELSLMFNMPVCKNLAEIVSKELGFKFYSEFDSNPIRLANCTTDADYVFFGHCISHGHGLRRAETMLASYNSHIKYALYFIDLQKFRDDLKGTEIFATLTKSDLMKTLF